MLHDLVEQYGPALVFVNVLAASIGLPVPAMPSLVLFGQDDRLVHPRLAERAARTFRDARVRVLPRTGHLAQMERPGLVAALFRELVAEARSAGADTGNSGRRDPVDAR